MKLFKVTIVLFGALPVIGCTTVANPSPNEPRQCAEGEQQVCRGASASRIESPDKDPHAVCTCVPRDEF